MQKPPSPHRWGLAHSFRSERKKGARAEGQGRRRGVRSRREAPPCTQPRRPAPALLTHARAPAGAHVQAVAAVAVAVVGAAGVHADAPAGAARLRLTLVHVWEGRGQRGVKAGSGASGGGRGPRATHSARSAHPRSSGAAGVTCSPGCKRRSSRRGPGCTLRGHRCSGSVGTHPSLRAGLGGGPHFPPRPPTDLDTPFLMIPIPEPGHTVTSGPCTPTLQS